MISARLICALSAAAILAVTPAASQPASRFSLASCTKLPQATEMHGCAVVGKRLYVFGGHTPVGYVNSVVSAEIADSGALSPWRAETPMPDLRAYIGNSVEVVNNRIYVISGTTTDKPFATDAEIRPDSTIVWTTVGADGRLAPWRKSARFADENRANVATCSTDKHLYVLGGNSSSRINNSVLIGDFDDDGTPVNWREAAPLPDPLWFQGAAILDNRMYVWGGLKARSNAQTNSRVTSTEVRADGSLGSWRDEAPMPEPLYSAAFSGFNDYLICVGGRLTGGAPTDTIWYSRLQGGRVEKWEKLTTDLQSRLYHTLGLDRSGGRIYVTGGRFRPPTVKTGGNPIDAVQAFQLGGSGRTTAAAASVPAPADAEAIRKSLASDRSVLLYFYSPEVPAVRRFEETVLSSPEFAALTGKFDVRSVDSSQDKVFSYKYGVFQVPSLTLLHPDGTVRRSGMLRSVDDVRTFLNGR